MPTSPAPLPPATRPTTLADVAAACGVSVATVSRALAGAGELAATTRTKVLRTAHELGYDRGASTRGRPPRRHPDLIDLVLGNFGAPWSDEAVAGARAAAARRGYDLTLTAERDTPEDDWPERLRARRPAGVVLGLILPTAAQLAVLARSEIPVVLLDPRSDQRHLLTSVRTTDRVGGADAARRLRDRGAAHLIIVEGTPAYRFGRARVAGFLDAAGTSGRIDRVRAGWSADSAAEAIRPILQAALDGTGEGEPVGVFTCSDEMAAGVYRAAAALGATVGERVLVIGFDDVRAASWMSPPLTTVHQPIRAMAAAAVGAVIDIVEGIRDPGGQTELPTRLVLRGSA